MVSISKSRVKPRRSPMNRKDKSQQQLITGVVSVLFLICILSVLMPPGHTTEDGATKKQWFRAAQEVDSYKADHVRLDLKSQSSPLLLESYNAIAMDIMETLDCITLLNKTSIKPVTDDFSANAYDQQQQNKDQERRRRLQEGLQVDDGDDAKQPADADGDNNNNQKGGDGGQMMDDYKDWENENNEYYFDPTAKELMCLAASTSTLDKESLKNMRERIQCDAAGTKQTRLLDLWSAARAQMEEGLLKKTLGIASESTRTILSQTVNLWAPTNDDGTNYILNDVNNIEASASDNGNNFHGLSHNLGPEHLFVDVGSCLGITTLAVILQYPKTRVVSIEPAAPNWFMQELNMRCNLDRDDQMPTIILSGVGPHTQETMAAKLLWRPTATTATRAWSPVEEKTDDDVELFVQLRSWKSILAQADVYSSHHIDVLHVDCEGCEYNLIPSLTEAEFESIDTVMGGMHWGYIPQHKLPSSERGKITHNRLCKHENFARTAKECCGNLDLEVKSSVPGEVLVQDGKDTATGGALVRNVIADGLCDDFETWQHQHRLYDVESDFGWFELSSVAT